eukprot:4312800-Amphidinium_carterae.1
MLCRMNHREPPTENTWISRVRGNNRSRFLPAHSDLLVDLQWNDEVVSEAFKSETGITINMLPWIVEEAVKEAIESPYPNNGQYLQQSEVNMIFGYTIGEEYGYKIVSIWFEGKKFSKNMVTSVSYKQDLETDPINGRQVKELNALEMEITADDSVSQIGQVDVPMPPPAAEIAYPEVLPSLNLSSEL